ncbi:MAG: aminotransferase class I/II-fold pyridoxal phosphate-dependent enzyme [Clostridia bacterium]|nr:aminotransferase class I/II-fold pyridoxal phosphate-dependent enzyme [Clostridia bacterium]
MSENKRIFLSSPHMSDEGYEMEYIKLAFDTNWIAPLGQNVDGFEKELCEYTGAKYAAALSAGTAAIHLALKAAGVKAGDRVFCPTLTFSATVNPVTYENAIPVFIDCDEKTWNMSPEMLEKAFEKYPDTKFVIVAHLYGLCADMDEIMRICREHNAVLIEDAAESLGTTYKGKMTGTFGDYGIFSFNGNKIITTSGGGALVCNIADDAKAEERIKKARFWATQSRDPARHYQHSEIGYNYRMSNVVAGIGRGQLKVLDKRVAQKKAIYKKYSEAFADIKDIHMMPVADFCDSNCWLSCLTLSGDKVQPLDILLSLEKENIEARPIWKPLHLQPVFAGCDYIGENNVAENIFNSGVCLPSDTKMTNEEIGKVIAVIKNLWK